MARKKWTAQTEVTDSLLKFREKRKWQLNYRRYVLEKMPCEGYARYFGLGIESLRSWFELQFSHGQNWENFGKAWQFYHIIPTHHFDFANEEDLQLCWNYINIGIEPLDSEADSLKIDPLATRIYFQSLYDKTDFSLCNKLLDKLTQIESTVAIASAIESFINSNKEQLEATFSFTQEEFVQLNQGMTVQEVLLEREILKKFG